MDKLKTPDMGELNEVNAILDAQLATLIDLFGDNLETLIFNVENGRKAKFRVATIFDSPQEGDLPKILGHALRISYLGEQGEYEEFVDFLITSTNRREGEALDAFGDPLGVQTAEGMYAIIGDIFIQADAEGIYILPFSILE